MLVNEGSSELTMRLSSVDLLLTSVTAFVFFLWRTVIHNGFWAAYLSHPERSDLHLTSSRARAQRQQMIQVTVMLADFLSILAFSDHRFCTHPEVSLCMK
jgi:hypothetical protein